MTQSISRVEGKEITLCCSICRKPVDTSKPFRRILADIRTELPTLEQTKDDYRDINIHEDCFFIFDLLKDWRKINEN